MTGNQENKTVLVMVPSREQDKQKFAQAAPGFSFIYNEAPTDEELGQANIIIGEPSQEMMDKAKSLEWLQITWAGVDDYVNDFNFPKNVFFTNMSGAFGQSISEYALAMMFFPLQTCCPSTGTTRMRKNGKTADGSVRPWGKPC